MHLPGTRISIDFDNTLVSLPRWFGTKLASIQIGLDTMQRASAPLVIAVGRELHTRLEGDARVVAWIGSAGVVEEVPAVLNQLADEIVSLQSKHGAIEVFAVHHGNEDGGATQRLVPPFEGFAAEPARHSHPPMLNISPVEFFTELTDQYLFAALHAMLYTPLMMENHDRVTHLGGGVRQLDGNPAQQENVGPPY